MFETCDVHESQSFNPFRPPDVRQWSAVSLNLDLAWFVLTRLCCTTLTSELVVVR
jgi:hypothetical protein